MTVFERKLNLEILTDGAIKAAPWFAELLRHWYPAGHAVLMVEWAAPPGSRRPSGLRPLGLRAAVRNGYMNFYNGGQSIAKVTIGNTLSAETHEKQLTDTPVAGQNYLKLGAPGAGHARIGDWISRSHAYQGTEKLFVEQVCVANPLLVDLKRGLPGLSLADRETGEARLVAPRIDIVALEPVPGGWQLAFWEAKLTSDSRIRARGEPEMIAQLGRYSQQFEQQGATASVLAACRNTCALLARLHARAAELGLSLPPPHDAILAIAADGDRLCGIDPGVRLLVDDRGNDAHFRAVHLPKLRAAGTQVHLVRAPADMPLPSHGDVPCPACP